VYEGKELPTPVVVEWIDAFSSHAEDFRDTEKESRFITYSCGFLIGRNSWGLVLAETYGEDGYEDFHFIPDEMVRHIYYGDEFDRDCRDRTTH